MLTWGFAGEYPAVRYGLCRGGALAGKADFLATFSVHRVRHAPCCRGGMVVSSMPLSWQRWARRPLRRALSARNLLARVALGRTVQPRTAEKQPVRQPPQTHPHSFQRARANDDQHWERLEANVTEMLRSGCTGNARSSSYHECTWDVPWVVGPCPNASGT